VTSQLSTWQQIAIVAAPAFAAIAALASWASIFQTRRLAREESSPQLQIQKVAASDGTIGVVITNAGGGAARGAGFYLSSPPYYAGSALGHGFIFPGETREVWTQIAVTDPPTQIDVLALCRDRRSFVHYWTADERHRILKNWRRRPKYSRDVPSIFRKFHPEVDLNALTRVPATVLTPT
jgi:hypothetical protein